MVSRSQKMRFNLLTIEVVTIDKSGANTAALATLNTDKEAITVRQSKYLNNLIAFINIFYKSTIIDLL